MQILQSIVLRVVQVQVQAECSVLGAGGEGWGRGDRKIPKCSSFGLLHYIKAPGMAAGVRLAYASRTVGNSRHDRAPHAN